MRAAVPITGGAKHFFCQRIPLSMVLKISVAADDTLIFFYFYLSVKLRPDASRESSARQRIHMKRQILFFLKNKEKYL